ncbi:MAG TPA: hypothetical protein VKU86_08225 [Acidimicrobiales bacterium]|nr:hypothetical protein [Acidimicrobiales bacterium]
MAGKRKELSAKEVNLRGVRARNRALSRLARKYPKDYRRLVNQERKKEDLEAIGVRPTGRRPRAPR